MSAFLLPFHAPAAQQPGTNYSVMVARSFLQRVPDPNSIHWVGQNNSFSWQAGYIMFAMEKMWRSTGDAAYFNYIKKYVDEHVDDKGNVPRFSSNALDNFLRAMRSPSSMNKPRRKNTGSPQTKCGMASSITRATAMAASGTGIGPNINCGWTVFLWGKCSWPDTAAPWTTAARPSGR